jgi:hypothetical protein
MKIIRGENAPGYDPKGPFLNGNKGKSFLNEDHKIMIDSLSPGPCLQELTSKVLEGVAGSINDMDGEGQTFALYRWMRDIITEASADAIYGPKNPFSGNQGLIDDLWYVVNPYSYIILSCSIRI